MLILTTRCFHIQIYKSVHILNRLFKITQHHVDTTTKQLAKFVLRVILISCIYGNQSGVEITNPLIAKSLNSHCFCEFSRTVLFSLHNFQRLIHIFL